MKTRIGLLMTSFIAFYAMIHLGRYLPDLYTGKFSLVDERSYDRRLFSLGADMLISFLFTFCAYFILYIFYPGKKYLFLTVSLAATFISCFVIDYLGTPLQAGEHLRLSRFFRSEILYSAFYTVFGMIFYFVRYSQFKELQQHELLVQNRDSELSFLRAQVNPHFLFNNLNNIYSLVYHQSDQSLTAISSLSEMLRYMLYDTSETLSLENEIHFIKKYIALEQLRFEHPCKLSFTCIGEISQVSLPPLLLIPFIENAFKHGAISFDRTWLDISINITSQEIVLCCTNDVGVKHKDATGGIGIENVRKRLALLYPANHNLVIEHQYHIFKVKLTLGKYSTSIKKMANEIS